MCGAPHIRIVWKKKNKKRKEKKARNASQTTTPDIHQNVNFFSQNFRKTYIMSITRSHSASSLAIFSNQPQWSILDLADLPQDLLTSFFVQHEVKPLSNGKFWSVFNRFGPRNDNSFDVRF